MNRYVVYLKDYEQHKRLIAVLTSREEAMLLSKVLNDKCDAAVGMDFDEILEFAEMNGLISLTKSHIREVKVMGSHFTFEEVKYKWAIDYSIFEADWDTTHYDHCTSDVHFFSNHDFMEFDEDYYDDLHFDHNMGCYYDLDLKHIDQNKLEKFVNGNNTYKWYDRKQAHPDVSQKLHWYDPIHDFCNNKGFRSATNKIERVIEKHVKHGGCTANVLVYKIKNCADYKHNHTFRRVAKRYIDALEQPQNFSWITNWEWCMGQYVYQDGCVMNKQDARKYWGYEEICDICGKDHGERNEYPAPKES